MRRIDGTVEAVVLAVSGSPDRKWSAAFESRLIDTRVEFCIELAFNYLSEQRLPFAQIQERLRGALQRLLAGGNAGSMRVWAHDLAVGRKLVLTRELSRACAARHVPLMSHHHDWWFHNRWRRRPDMRRCGFRTLAAAAHTMLPTSPASVCATHRWLARELADDAPVWILSCRLLRRKNVAEALLLTRWLRMEAWLVTTGGASSAEEQFHYDQLGIAARRHR